MKTTTVTLFLGLAALLAPWVASAQPNPNPPGQISYQGFLTDANGIPLATNAPKNYTIIFRVWDSSSSGSNIWAEQQVVTVDRGYFTVMLGNGSSVGAPFTNNLTTIFAGSSASDRYLGITATDLSPSEIVPRLRLLASPYSLLASRAMSVDAGGKVPDSSLSTNIALRAGGNTFNGTQIITNGTLAIGTNFTGLNTVQINPNFETANGYALVACKADYGENVQINRSAGQYGIGLIVDDTAAGDANTTLFAARNNSAVSPQYLFDILANGNIGIGTGTPGFPLSFPNTLGDKISLWGTSGNNFGFGIQGSQLQIHTDISGSDIVFGYGQSAAMTETMRITGTGNLVIGNSGTILAKNASGTIENFLYPRWSDNASYLNYGSAGFYVRNNSSASTMFMANNGYVGIANINPGRLLQIGGPTSQTDALINLGCGNGSANRSWEIGVPYGTNSVSGDYYSFVIRDTGAGDRMVVNFNSGYVGIGTSSPQQALHVIGNILASGTVTQGSDRNTKENFAPISPAEVLDRVAAMPISRWNYKADRQERHLGPMAQDFYAAFGLGMDDKHISMVDADGVALAAIQGLNQKLEQKEAEITDLKSRLERLEQLLNHSSNGAAR
jgi:hypothetical protein